VANSGLKVLSILTTTSFALAHEYAASIDNWVVVDNISSSRKFQNKEILTI